jgi:hypothetical protein
MRRIHRHDSRADRIGWLFEEVEPSPGSRSSLKNPLERLENPVQYIIVFRGRGDGRGYRNVCKITRGRE